MMNSKLISKFNFDAPLDKRASLLGLIFLICGAFSVVLPGVVTFALEYVMGIILIVVGALGVLSELSGARKTNFQWRIAAASAMFLAGVVLALSPGVGSLTLTLILGIYFLFAGVNKTALALREQLAGTSGWLFFIGLVDLLLGVVIIANWFELGSWLLGLLLGVSLMLHGWWLILCDQSEQKQ